MNDSTTLPCGACAGVTRETPAAIYNRAGLSQIAYRVGTYASFDASLLASLTDPAYAAIAQLTTRETDDFTIALLDAFAVTADILTFYQERLANESYLRTAIQPRSVFELARLVGYQPSPGVSAGSPLAVTLNNAPGAPDPALIPAGMRVQSVPPPGQKPAVFETSVDLTARIANNAIPPVTTTPVDWSAVTTSLWLAGTATGLKTGDSILLVDAARTTTPGSQAWEFRTITAVMPDPTNNRTLIAWDVPLFPYFQENAQTVQLYSIGRPASLFGVNAPDPQLLAKVLTEPPTGADWAFVHDLSHIDLDTTYSGLAPVAAQPQDFVASPQRFTWVVLSDGRERRLYQALAAADRAPLRYTLSAKATGLSLDRDTGLADFVSRTRQVTAFLSAQPLAIAPQPLIAWTAGPPLLAPGMLEPVCLSGVTLAGGALLTAGQTVAISGQRARLQLMAGQSATLIGPDGETAIPFNPGDMVLRRYAYPPISLASAETQWAVLTTQGVSATLTAAASALALQPADPKSRTRSSPKAAGAGYGSADERRTDGPDLRQSARSHLRPRDHDLQRQRGRGDARADRAGGPRQRRRLAAEPELHAEANAADLSQHAERTGNGFDAAGVGERSALAGRAEPARRDAERSGLQHTTSRQRRRSRLIKFGNGVQGAAAEPVRQICARSIVWASACRGTCRQAASAKRSTGRQG